MLKLWEVIDNPFGKWKVRVFEVIQDFSSWKISIELEYYEKAEKPKQEDTVLVPDNIKIEAHPSFWLCISNDKQFLWFYNGVYRVSISDPNCFVRCKLIPIDVKDLEVGGTYFMSDSDDIKDSIKKLFFYCKYLWNNSYVRWYGKSIECATDTKWEYRYKVVPID